MEGEEVRECVILNLSHRLALQGEKVKSVIINSF